MKRFLRDRVGNRGNAVLFSLVIMGSALTASLGMTALVASEIRNVALIPPSERAYYKAESYIEQGLWEKKQDPNFQHPPADDPDAALPTDFLCPGGDCFESDPGDQAGLLTEFVATTSPVEEEVPLKQDVPQQLDIATTATTPDSGCLDLGTVSGESGFNGVEVSIIAFPDSDATDRFPTDNPSTPVFVEKKVIPAGDSPDILLGAGTTNALGEQSPPLKDSTFRLRLKALGADASIEPRVSTGGCGSGNLLALRSPDFTVRAVAKDASAQRGIQVLTPAAEEIVNVFDHVLFSDLDLSKLDAKVPEEATSQSVVVPVRMVSNCSSGSERPIPAIDHGSSILNVTITGGQSAPVGSGSQVIFTNLEPGLEYQVNTTSAGNWYMSCGARSVVTQANQQVTAPTLRVVPRSRIPLYRLWSLSHFADHFYTINVNEYNQRRDLISGAAPYNSPEGITGYVYQTQKPGTGPFYRLWKPGVADHFYTMSTAERNSAVAVHGYVYQNISGYMWPYNGTCPEGTTQLYRSNRGDDHLYTTSISEWNSAAAASPPWVKEGIAGCIWTTPQL